MTHMSYMFIIYDSHFMHVTLAISFFPDIMAVVFLRIGGGFRPPFHQPIRQQTSRPVLHRLRHALVLLRTRPFHFLGHFGRNLGRHLLESQSLLVQLPQEIKIR